MPGIWSRRVESCIGESLNPRCCIDFFSPKLITWVYCRLECIKFHVKSVNWRENPLLWDVRMEYDAEPKSDFFSPTSAVSEVDTAQSASPLLASIWIAIRSMVEKRIQIISLLTFCFLCQGIMVKRGRTKRRRIFIPILHMGKLKVKDCFSVPLSTLCNHLNPVQSECKMLPLYREVGAKAKPCKQVSFQWTLYPRSSISFFLSRSCSQLLP